MSISKLIKLIKVTEGKLKDLKLELSHKQRQCKHDYNSFTCVHCNYNLLEDLNTNNGIYNLSGLKTKYIIDKNKQGLKQIELVCAFMQMAKPTFPNYKKL